MLLNNVVKSVVLCLVLFVSISNATDLSKSYLKKECEITTFKDNSSNFHLIYLRQWPDGDYRYSLWICNDEQRIELDKNIQAEIFCKNVTLTLGLFCNQTVQENQTIYSRNVTYFSEEIHDTFFRFMFSVIMLTMLFLFLMSYPIWNRLRKLNKAPRTHCPRCGRFCESVCSFFACLFEDENDDIFETHVDKLPIEKCREQDVDQEFCAYSAMVNTDQVSIGSSQEWSGDSDNISFNVAASPVTKLLPNCVKCVPKLAHSNYEVKDNFKVESELASTNNVHNLGEGCLDVFDNRKKLSIQKNLPVSYSNATASINVMSDPGCAGFAQEYGNRKNINNNDTDLLTFSCGSSQNLLDNENNDTNLLTFSSGGSSQDLLDKQTFADCISAFSSYAVPQLQLDQSRNSSVTPVSDQVCGAIAQTFINPTTYFNDNIASSVSERILLHDDKILRKQHLVEGHSAVSSVVDKELNFLGHIHELPDCQEISEVQSLNSLFPVSEPHFRESEHFLVKQQYNGIKNDNATYQGAFSNLVRAGHAQELVNDKNVSHDDETTFLIKPMHLNCCNSQNFFKNRNTGGSIIASPAYVNNMCAAPTFDTEDNNETSLFKDRDPSSGGNDQQLEATNYGWNDTGMTSSSQLQIESSAGDSQELIFSKNASDNVGAAFLVCSQAMARSPNNGTALWKNKDEADLWKQCVGQASLSMQNTLSDERRSNCDSSEVSEISFETVSYESASLSSGSSGYDEENIISSDDGSDRLMNICR